ncbi:39S ribosomal protein L13, mitochondrial-like isoform X2 [Gigantopelta aegis]|uniref:39S ribosomal protein L13, mitochondrial-like isoform X2 n=1 Tax=Gigantopelta aegis TaxID=1735272 RepID=UPI001B88909B|nr:39S ribosomal protein L13, mitochondrial-like isoform X2 [Gigantopelta aegis]
MANNRVLQWATFARTWWIFDAKHQCPIKSSRKIAHYLQGFHKPVYHPLSDIGDHVVVFNSKHIAMKGEYWRTWKYFHHTGYPRGASWTSAWRMHDMDQTKIITKHVYSTLPGTLLRRTMMRRLHVFPDENIPEEILRNVTDQIHQVQPIPRRLDEYTSEEIENFPQLFDWPEEFVINYGKKKPPR